MDVTSSPGTPTDSGSASSSVPLASLSSLAHDLASGAVTSRQLIDEALARIEAPGSEGPRAFLSVSADQARAAADGYDAMRQAGAAVPPFAGVPFAVKDLCDVGGEVTGAGSVVLDDRGPATVNAPALERVVRAGFVPIGRTNMTEFAYSGLGLNSHFPAPSSPWERDVAPRIPGGSSSGTAVAVADGMAAAGLGTDTGGSCRIPAAFCGIVGYKPTARRVPLDGIVPLSTSLDSVGPLAPSVECCAIVDDLFSGGDGTALPEPRPLDRIRLAVPTDFVLDGLDDTVAATFEASLGRLSDAGVHIGEVAFPELNELPDINAKGGLAVAEAYHWHRELLAARGDDYDQRVRVRIEPGADMSAAEYLDVLAARRRLIELAARRSMSYDAWVLPTVAIVAPTLASYELAAHSGDEAAAAEYYRTTNLMCLRNTSVGNFLDSCSISLPAHDPGETPVGLMLMGAPMADRDLFACAAGIEHVLRPYP